MSLKPALRIDLSLGWSKHLFQISVLQKKNIIFVVFFNSSVEAREEFKISTVLKNIEILNEPPEPVTTVFPLSKYSLQMVKNQVRYRLHNNFVQILIIMTLQVKIICDIKLFHSGSSPFY